MSFWNLLFDRAFVLGVLQGIAVGVLGALYLYRRRQPTQDISGGPLAPPTEETEVAAQETSTQTAQVCQHSIATEISQSDEIFTQAAESRSIGTEISQGNSIDFEEAQRRLTEIVEYFKNIGRQARVYEVVNQILGDRESAEGQSRSYSQSGSQIGPQTAEALGFFDATIDEVEDELDEDLPYNRFAGTARMVPGASFDEAPSCAQPRNNDNSSNPNLVGRQREPFIAEQNVHSVAQQNESSAAEQNEQPVTEQNRQPGAGQEHPE